MYDDIVRQQQLPGQECPPCSLGVKHNHANGNPYTLRLSLLTKTTEENCCHLPSFFDYQLSTSRKLKIHYIIRTIVLSNSSDCPYKNVRLCLRG